MPVVFNFLFVGTELAVLFFEGSLFLGILIMGTEVAIGELISVIVGYFLSKALAKRNLFA